MKKTVAERTVFPGQQINLESCKSGKTCTVIPSCEYILAQQWFTFLLLASTVSFANTKNMLHSCLWCSFQHSWSRSPVSQCQFKCIQICFTLKAVGQSSFITSYLVLLQHLTAVFLSQRQFSQLVCWPLLVSFYFWSTTKLPLVLLCLFWLWLYPLEQSVELIDPD